MGLKGLSAWLLNKNKRDAAKWQRPSDVARSKADDVLGRLPHFEQSAANN
jgi:hypothetical protein